MIVSCVSLVKHVTMRPIIEDSPGPEVESARSGTPAEPISLTCQAESNHQDPAEGANVKVS
jgi:hypothetical protein